MTIPPDASLDSRRDFLRKAAVIAAGGTVGTGLIASIQRALAIEPAAGSSFRDAEHIVILMQENRSFDHMFGTLRGVRGFNDPRAVSLPDGRPVWWQSDEKGDTYGPFRLDLRGSRATWMGELPHGRRDQGEARNQGKHNRWLVAKPIENRSYAGFPLTLGYYTREDLPFYYQLADAFTVCDQAFCSVLGPTTPNRLHLWTGTVRPEPAATARAHVQNEDTDFGAEVSWHTYPERLQAAGISWKVYQNELAVPSGLEGERDAWLSNFGDNPLEFFTQYAVYFAAPHRRYLADLEAALARELAGLGPGSSPRRAEVEKQLAEVRVNRTRWTEEAFAKLPAHQQQLHHRAFVTNAEHPQYRELDALRYVDTGTAREMTVPKGDLLHQFRADVRSGSLPTVSWLVPPERLSDHPSNPWYGALYVSETLDILTENPEVWKKTVLVLCYDENDGYFDHVPPFVPPRADRADPGRVGPGIDTSAEYVREDSARDPADNGPGAAGRDGPIGLGYRVPLVIASPWTRGGYVCSEVFDHTSILRFLEEYTRGRFGLSVRESNISSWRRAVCGDLTSAFRPFEGGGEFPTPIAHDAFLVGINQAQFKPVPTSPSPHRSDAAPGVSAFPRQEAGTRPSCGLPYELVVGGRLAADRSAFQIEFAADRQRFGPKAAGAPFHVYAPVPHRTAAAPDRFETGRCWAYAVAPGTRVADHWPLAGFADERYGLRVHGPNGFFREFCGDRNDPDLELTLTAGAQLQVVNRDPRQVVHLRIEDLGYGAASREIAVPPANTASVPLDFAPSHGWYDLRVTALKVPSFSQRWAGRLETGREGRTDPLLA